MVRLLFFPAVRLARTYFFLSHFSINIFSHFLFFTRFLLYLLLSPLASSRASGENRFVNCGKVSVERVEAPKLPIHGNSFRAEKHTVLFPSFPFDDFHFHEVWSNSRYNSIHRVRSDIFGCVFPHFTTYAIIFLSLAVVFLYAYSRFYSIEFQSLTWKWKKWKH